MLVRATREGYYAGQLRAPGAVFDMKTTAMKQDKSGKIVFASWFEAADAPAAAPRKEVEPAKTSDGKDKQVI